MPITVREIRVNVDKASPIGERPTPDVRIDIVGRLREFGTLEEAASSYDAQAMMIESALRQGLPGGTYDRLLGYMLRYKSSHFRVAHAQLGE